MSGFTLPNHVKISSQAISSTVVGVPRGVVAAKLKNVLAIRDYGRDSLISCCVMENDASPRKVGAVRRCTIELDTYRDTLLRERLVKMEEDEYRTTVVMGYIPCTPDEAHRSPFGAAMNALTRATITYVASTVTSSLNRTYLEASVSYDVLMAGDPNADPALRVEELQEKRAIDLFWQLYLDVHVRAIETYVLTEAYPLLEGRIDHEFRHSFEEHEEIFCSWAADISETLSRDAVVEEVEKILVCWSRVLQEYRHQKLVAETVKADVDGSRKVASECAQQLAEAVAALAEEQLQIQSSLPPEKVEQQMNGVSATSTTTLGTGEAPKSTPARGTGSLNRVSGSLPHDRRHTTVPRVDSTAVEFAEALLPSAPPVSVKRFTPSSATLPRLPGRFIEGSTQHTFWSDLLPPSHTAPAASARAITKWSKAPGLFGRTISQGTSKTATGFEPPTVLYSSILRHLFHLDGSLDEAAAAQLFTVLQDASSRDAVTKRGIVDLLQSVDSCGLWEGVPVNALQDELSYRRAVKKWYTDFIRAGGPARARISVPRPSLTDTAATTATAAGEGGCAAPASPSGVVGTVNDSPLQKLVERHAAAREAYKADAIEKLAASAIRQFAFHEGGRLNFEEFCLAMIHLWKD